MFVSQAMHTFTLQKQVTKETVLGKLSKVIMSIFANLVCERKIIRILY